MSRALVEQAVAEQSKAREMNYVVRWDGASEKPQKTGVVVGDQAPTFSAPLLAGGEFNAANSLGKRPLVIVFWASWCKPCLLEAPHLSKLHNLYADKGIDFIAISIDELDGRKSLLDVVTTLQVSYPVAVDPKGEVLAKYASTTSGTSIPLTFVIAKDGTVLYRHQNFEEGDEMALGKVLRQASTPDTQQPPSETQ